MDPQPLTSIDRAILKLAGIWNEPGRVRPRHDAPTQDHQPRPTHRRNALPRRIPALRPAKAVAAQTPDERREHPRRDGNSQVAMSFGVMDAADSAWKLRSTPHRGHLVDLSMRGCAFISRLPASPHASVALRLADDQFDDGRILRARIIRCDRRLDDEYRIVCRFDENLSLEDLYQFGRHTFSHNIV